MPIPQIDPQRGADALRRLLIGSDFDPVELDRLRGERADELSDRLINDESASAIPSYGYEQGEPGRRSVSNAGDRMNAHRDRLALQRVSSERHSDPFTGDAERARIARTQDALDTASIINRPEVGDASRTTAERNAFGAFLNAEAPYRAQTSDVGRQALDEASRRKIGENQATWMSKDAAKGLSAEGTKAMEALTQSVNLGRQLKTLLEKKISENPSAVTPEKARETGILGQLFDVGEAKAKRALYSHGFVQPPEGYDEATQLADWMKVLATRGLLGGVRNMEWISQIQDHLASGRLPDAANLQRLNVFLEQAPKLAGDIVSVEKGHDYSLGMNRPGAAAPTAPAAGATGSAYDRYLARRPGGQQ